MSEKNEHFDTQELKQDAKDVGKWLIKPTVGTGVYKRVYTDLKDTGKQGFSLAKWIFTSKRENERFIHLKDKTDYKERFKTSMRMRNIKEKQLSEIEKEMEWNLFAWFGAIGLLLLYVIGTSGRDLITFNFKLFTLLPVLGLFALLISLASRASFRLYQVRNRACMPFSDWLKDKNAWLGGKSSGLTTVLILGMIFSVTAMAQQTASVGSSGGLGAISTYMSQVPNTDLSLKWLQSLFPDITSSLNSVSALSSSSSSGTDLFRDMFQVMNSIVLGVACAMMTYQTIIGTIATAHEGEVLGRRWNTAFAPARIVLGIGSLAPIKGYCLAQMLVVWILFAGYSMADAIWIQEVSSITSGTPIVSSQISSLPSNSTLAFNILQSKVCAQVYLENNVTSDKGDTNTMAVLNPQIVTNSDNSMTVNFGSACGSITLPSYSYNKVTNYLSSGVNQDSALASQVSSPITALSEGIANIATGHYTAYSQAFNTYQEARKNQLQTLINSVCVNKNSGSSGSCDDNSWPVILASSVTDIGKINDTALSNLTKDGLSGFINYLSGLSTAEAVYNQSLREAVGNLANTQSQNSQDDLLNYAKLAGWASAGSLNNSLVQISANMMDTYNKAVPVYIAPNIELFNNKEYMKQYSTIMTYINNHIDSYNQTASTLFSSPTQYSANSNSGTSILGKIFNAPLSAYASGGVTSKLSLNANNPLGTIQTQGLLLIYLAEAIFGIYIAAAMLSGATSNGGWTSFIPGKSEIGGAAKAGIGAVSGMVYMVVGSILAFGIIEAYILPMVPYIMWTFAVFECAAFAICFVVAAPFAAFMHIRMDGDELIGNPQSVYYRMLFDGAVRPTLLIFGLIAFTKMFAVMISYIDATFSTAMMSSVTSSGFGIFGFIAEIGIFVYLHYQICTKSMELIHRVPEMVARICGIQSSFADPGQTTHQFSGVAVSTGRMASTGISRGVQNANEGAQRRKNEAANEIMRQEKQAKDDLRNENQDKIMGQMASYMTGQNINVNSAEGANNDAMERSLGGKNQNQNDGSSQNQKQSSEGNTKQGNEKRISEDD